MSLHDTACPENVSLGASGSVRFHNKLIEEVSLSELLSRKRWYK
jgi:hypothetical protein